jgi:hypothetical protein
MTGEEQEFSAFALEAQRLFQEAVDEALARQVSLDEFEATLLALGFHRDADRSDKHVWCTADGRRVAVPTREPIGMAPLLAALRAAAGIGDAAA